MIITLIGIIGPMLVNFTILFNRKKKWIVNIYRWYMVLGMFLVSLLILTFSNTEFLDERQMLAIWGLMTPAIFSLLDYFFKIISLQIHNRDLYLWINGSNDIDGSKLSGGKHVRASDRILSMILLFSVLILPFLILVVIGD